MKKISIGSHDVDSHDDEPKKSRKRGEIGLCLLLFLAPRSLSIYRDLYTTSKLRNSS